MIKFCNFIEKWLQQRCCPVTFLWNFKYIYSVEHLQTSAENNIKASINFLQFLFNVKHLFHFDLIKFDWIVTELFD